MRFFAFVVLLLAMTPSNVNVKLSVSIGCDVIRNIHYDYICWMRATETSKMHSNIVAVDVVVVVVVVCIVVRLSIVIDAFCLPNFHSIHIANRLQSSTFYFSSLSFADLYYFVSFLSTAVFQFVSLFFFSFSSFSGQSKTENCIPFSTDEKIIETRCDAAAAATNRSNQWNANRIREMVRDVTRREWKKNLAKDLQTLEWNKWILTSGKCLYRMKRLEDRRKRTRETESNATKQRKLIWSVANDIGEMWTQLSLSFRGFSAWLNRGMQRWEKLHFVASNAFSNDSERLKRIRAKESVMSVWLCVCVRWCEGTERKKENNENRNESNADG